MYVIMISLTHITDTFHLISPGIVVWHVGTQCLVATVVVNTYVHVLCDRYVCVGKTSRICDCINSIG